MSSSPIPIKPSTGLVMLPLKKEKPEPRNELLTEGLTILRKKNRELDQENKSLKERLRAYEALTAREGLEAQTVRRSFDALIGAVSVLAEQVPNKSRAGREARELARRRLEEKGIKPPSSLGSSRKRPTGRGKKKKNS